MLSGTIIIVVTCVKFYPEGMGMLGGRLPTGGKYSLCTWSSKTLFIPLMEIIASDRTVTCQIQSLPVIASTRLRHNVSPMMSKASLDYNTNGSGQFKETVVPGIDKEEDVK